MMLFLLMVRKWRYAVVNADDEEGYYAAAADNDEDGVKYNLKTKIIMKRNIKIKLF